MEIGPNQVYVIPPDAILTIQGGTLHLARPAPPAARRTSINAFLISLAEDQGENAVGIILSGLRQRRRARRRGDQGAWRADPEPGRVRSPRQERHAAECGRPAAWSTMCWRSRTMPAALLEYRHHRTICDAAKGPDGIRQDLPEPPGDDLRGAARQARPRLQPVQDRHAAAPHPAPDARAPDRRGRAYIEQLRTLPHEAELLFRELLISVTRFFRDPEAFAALEAQGHPGAADGHAQHRADPGLGGRLRHRRGGLLARHPAPGGLARSGARRPVQIFATDIDDRAIEVARAGLYPGSDRRRHLRRAAGAVLHQGGRQLPGREEPARDVPVLDAQPGQGPAVLAARPGLLPQPADLLRSRSCSSGCSPPSTTPCGRAGTCSWGRRRASPAQSRLFAPLDKRQRLYVRRDTAGAAAGLPALARALAPACRQRSGRVPADDQIGRQAARAMARYAPAFVVVDRQHDVLRFSGQVAKYLEPADRRRQPEPAQPAAPGPAGSGARGAQAGCRDRRRGCCTTTVSIAARRGATRPST